MKKNELFPKWFKRVTCPICGTKRSIEVGQQKYKCCNCKAINKVVW